MNAQAETKPVEERTNAARSYVRRGWSLVPLNGKKPIEKDWTNLPPTTEAQAIEYAKRGNFGIRTGKISGIIVVDIDIDHNGIENAKSFNFPRTPTVRTGSGGYHLYFKYPKGGLSNSASKLAPGIDFRGDGGQAVASPSIHPRTGKPYAWMIHPDDCPLSELPPDILNKLREKKTSFNGKIHNGNMPPLMDRIKRASTYLAKIPGAETGEGGHDTTWKASLAIVKGFSLSEDVAFDLLWREYNPQCNPPWSEKELLHKVTQAAESNLEDGYLLKDATYFQKMNGNAEIHSKDSFLLTLVNLSDVVPEKVEWLWPGYIPIGKITLIDGDPGLGKSMMTLDIASKLSKGVAMPDGAPCAQGGTVLMTLEDGLADTIRPRLDAAGADPSQIVALQGVSDEEGKPRIPTLSDIQEITQAVKEIDAKLVIIDPLMAYLPGQTNSFRDQDVRQILSPLAAMAEKLQVAVIVIRHLNKSGGSQSIYRGGGSIGIIGAVRCGLLVGKDPDDENRRILAGIKSNIGKIPESLSFHIEGGEGAAKIVWGGVSEHTADNLLSIPQSQEEKSALDEAKEFLTGLLSKGSVEVKKIRSESNNAGINSRTLDRAKAALSIKADKGGFSDPWFWTLPETQKHQVRQEKSKYDNLNDGVLGETLSYLGEKRHQESKNKGGSGQWNLL